MMLFGEVETEMMEWMIKNQPTAAEAWIEKLCAIKWHQYLTKKEAQDVINSMIPKAPWTYEAWESAMSKMQLEIEKEYDFNKYATWVAMSQVYTDFGETLAKTLNTPLNSIPVERLLPIIYDMAMDLLLDKDGVYDIRKYHLHKHE